MFALSEENVCESWKLLDAAVAAPPPSAQHVQHVCTVSWVFMDIMYSILVYDNERQLNYELKFYTKLC